MSTGSPRTLICVRASFNTTKPASVSAAGISRSSSWLPSTAKTPDGADSFASASAAGWTNR